jgi:hypothetical protein
MTFPFRSRRVEKDTRTATGKEPKLDFKWGASLYLIKQIAFQRVWTTKEFCPNSSNTHVSNSYE